MDLVDEQHVARLEIRDDGDEVARLLQRRAGGRAHAGVHLVRDDVRERGLAEAGRTEEQHVIERSLRLRAAVSEISRFALTFCCPMYSRSIFGRSESSVWRSSWSVSAARMRSSVTERQLE
jgi:hypothetical protein